MIKSCTRTTSFAKETHILNPDRTFWTNYFHRRDINFFENLQKVMLINPKTIVFNEKTDSDVNIYVEKIFSSYVLRIDCVIDNVSPRTAL